MRWVSIPYTAQASSSAATASEAIQGWSTPSRFFGRAADYLRNPASCKRCPARQSRLPIAGRQCRYGGPAHHQRACRNGFSIGQRRQQRAGTPSTDTPERLTGSATLAVYDTLLERGPRTRIRAPTPQAESHPVRTVHMDGERRRDQRLQHDLANHDRTDRPVANNERRSRCGGFNHHERQQLSGPAVE